MIARCPATVTAGRCLDGTADAWRFACMLPLGHAGRHWAVDRLHAGAVTLTATWPDGAGRAREAGA